jgi:hypothetical protein
MSFAQPRLSQWHLTLSASHAQKLGDIQVGNVRGGEHAVCTAPYCGDLTLPEEWRQQQD